jgi:hypothetical protein
MFEDWWFKYVTSEVISVLGNPTLWIYKLVELVRKILRAV